MYGIATGVVVIAVLILSIVATAAVGGLGWLTGLRWLSGPSTLVSVCTGMIGLFFFLVFLAVRKHVNRRVRNLCTLHDDRSTEKLVQIIVEDFGRPGVSTLAQALALVLAEVRVPGFVIRCCPPEHRDVIEPVAIPFEPLVLDESDDATAAFRDAMDSSGGHDENEKMHDHAEEPESRLMREVHRRNKLAGVSGWWLGLIAVGVAVGSAVGDNLATAAIIIAVFAFMLFAGSSSSRLLSNRDCWLLVPGGLLVRGSGWRRGGFSLQRYERSQAVLVVLRSKGMMWLAAVSDGQSLHSTSVTKDEVNLLLCCWLSPLEPLPLERYGDLLMADG